MITFVFMTLKANTNGNMKWAGALMAGSILLLVCFTGYWLNSQYNEEKLALKKEFQADLAATQREIVDSILFERYVGPMFKGGDTSNIQKILKSGRPLPAGKFRTVTYISDEDSTKIDSISNAMTDKLTMPDKKIRKTIGDSNVEEHYSFSYTFSDVDSITMTTGINQVKEIQLNTSLPDSNIINAVTGLLRTVMKDAVKDSLSKVSFIMQPEDLAVVKTAFVKTITTHNQSLKLQWLNDSAATSKNNKHAIILPYNIYETKGKIAVTGYGPYLLQKIVPQFLFALFLIFFVTMAFVVTYRNLQRQIKLSEMKNSLISNMSHELKTPVATVRVALEAIGDYGVINNPAQALEYVEMAKLETQRLEMLINKALNTSLLEQGKISLQYERTDIAELTNGIIQSLKLRLQQNNTQINLSTEGNNFTIDIDRLHIQGVLLNIIDNSIKYGQPPVVIDIHIMAQDATVTVTISDNGPGIPEQYTEQIFEKFFRIPTGDKHNVQGYGLGLSYVKQVMQLHGGMVQQRNKANGGSKFTLQFFRGR